MASCARTAGQLAAATLRPPAAWPRSSRVDRLTGPPPTANRTTTNRRLNRGRPRNPNLPPPQRVVAFWLGSSPSTFYRLHTALAVGLGAVRWAVYRSKRWVGAGRHTGRQADRRDRRSFVYLSAGPAPGWQLRQ